MLKSVKEAFANIALYSLMQVIAGDRLRTDSDAPGRQCHSDKRWILCDGWPSQTEHIAVLIKAALQSAR